VKELKQYWKTHRELLLAWLFGVMFALQILNLHSYVVQTVDHQAIVAANDDDASWNVRKTVKTRWWKDNGWILYGPAYFRLNHTIQYFWNRTADTTVSANHEAWEKTAHHAILTTSLLALAAVALLIACQFLTFWWQRFLFSFGLLAAFTSIPAYAELILRAHPDMLFALVGVAAMALTIRMFQEPGDKLWFYLSAILWGISVSVKMTIVLYVPGFFILFVPPFKKSGFVRGLKYLGVMFASYFLIGFPQTIVLDRAYRAGAKLSSLNLPVTVESVVKWLKLYAAQGWPLVIILGLALLDFERRKQPVPKNSLWRIWVFVLLPFALLLQKNMVIPVDHYPIALWAMLVLVAAMFLPFPSNKIFSGQFPLVRAGLFLTIVLAVFGSTPQAMQVELDKRLKCRTEARDTYSRVRELYNQGRNVWVDPYVPFPTDAPQSRVELSWEKSWDGYQSGGWNALALNKPTVSNFTGPEVDAATKADIPGWAKAREFYLAFINGDEARTPQGHVFKRVYQNACGHEIWLRD
jgi:hypothetical protein